MRPGSASATSRSARAAPVTPGNDSSSDERSRLSNATGFGRLQRPSPLAFVDGSASARPPACSPSRAARPALRMLAHLGGDHSHDPPPGPQTATAAGAGRRLRTDTAAQRRRPNCPEAPSPNRATTAQGLRLPGRGPADSWPGTYTRDGSETTDTNAPSCPGVNAQGVAQDTPTSTAGPAAQPRGVTPVGQAPRPLPSCPPHGCPPAPPATVPARDASRTRRPGGIQRPAPAERRCWHRAPRRSPRSAQPSAGTRSPRRPVHRAIPPTS